LLLTSVPTAGHELPRPKHLTLEAKVAWLERTVRHDRDVIRYYAAHPRLLSRASARRSLAWHRDRLRRALQELTRARAALRRQQARRRTAGPFARPIPPGAKVDPNSGRYVRALAEAVRSRGFFLTVRRWSVPVYYANKSTPRRDVRLTASWRAVDWMLGVPIPPDAAPDPEDDGHMTVLEPSTGCEFDFYRAHKVNGSWSADWGNTLRTSGSGVYPYAYSTRGSGFSNLAGLIWPAELKAREIKHALMFSYPLTSAAGAVPPATETDGQSTRSDALPEGARLQLDPSLDLGRLGLRPYERTVARALQRYGMYLGDTNGGGVGLYAVSPQSYSSNPYAGLLPADPYPRFANIPVERFRVIELGPVIPPSVLRSRARLVRTGCATMR
jgi:hypothetical protein